MADFDVFDMVGLAFDPPETNARQVKKKIDQKKAELGSALGRETQQTNRDALQAQIDYLDGIAIQILSPDGKKLIDSAFKPLADRKTAAELSSLSATVELLALTGGHTVTEATIRHYKKESRLSVEHVKKAFTDAGFEIIDKDPLAAIPKFPTNADRIYSELAALRRTKDPNPNGADTSVVADLYSFAAYISNDTENIALYKAMDTKELWGIFDPASRRYSQRNDDLGKLCGSLSAAAKTYVFNSDENRAAYEKHLVYRSVELTKLFSTMKRAPEATLRNPRFADSCIKSICEFFSDFDVALAIYNKEGELDPPYIPIEWKYVIKCACGFVNEYDSEADAKKANACNNCRKPLFKKCDKCKRLIPIQAEKCPFSDCGYVFASAALFSRFFQQAEAAFRRSDFDAARQYLFQAQTAAPGEKARIDRLNNQIDKKEHEFSEPINSLRQLITERKFNTAKTELGSIIRKYPNLNVAEFDQTINGELARADRLFSSVSNSSASKKADMCITILMQCVDYPPALSFLRATTPIPSSSISVVPVSGTGVINVSWGHSTEQGVSYRLVRKKGKVAPSSENDGELLADKTSATSFTDERIKPGQIYTYSVFTVRWDVYSSPVSKTGILYADVKNFHVFQRQTGVRITWDSPDNSRGATVVRICEGKNITLTDEAHGSYEDSGTQYGKTYTYRVFANYDGNNRSPGVESSAITPLPIVDSFSIRATQVRDNVYKISWTVKQRGIDLRVMVNGKLSVEAKSEDGAAQATLPKETFCKINVIAYSGGKWISSENSVEVNTYSSVGIDKKATSMEESMISGRNGISYRIDLKIYLSGKIPSNVSSFYYTVRTAKSTNRWATLEEIGKSLDIQKVSLATYQKQGFIPYQDFVLNETTFFISVFTCYSAGGKEIVSEPQKMKIDRPLSANLFWSVSYGMFDGLKLMIELSGNKSIEYVPELYLCVCDAGQFIASQDDKNAELVMKVPSVDLDTPVTEYRKSYSVKTNLPAKYLKKCRYFLFEQDTTSGDNIMLRWKQGFSGKV